MPAAPMPRPPSAPPGHDLLDSGTPSKGSKPGGDRPPGGGGGDRSEGDLPATNDDAVGDVDAWGLTAACGDPPAATAPPHAAAAAAGCIGRLGGSGLYDGIAQELHVVSEARHLPAGRMLLDIGEVGGDDAVEHLILHHDDHPQADLLHQDGLDVAPATFNDGCNQKS